MKLTAHRFNLPAPHEDHYVLCIPSAHTANVTEYFLIDETQGDPVFMFGLYSLPEQDEGKIALENALDYIPQHDNRNRETARAILDVFEELLEEHKIIIPDDDRPEDNDTPLYGCTYGDLLDKISTILEE